VVVRSHSSNLSVSGLRALVGTLAFAAGLLVAREGGRGFLLGAPALLASAHALIRSFRATTGARAGRGSWIIAILGMICAGFVTGRGHDHFDQAPRLLECWARHGFEAGHTPVLLRGRVTDVQSVEAGRVALWMRVQRYLVRGQSPLEGTPRQDLNVRLTTPLPPDRRESPWQPGDLLELTARIGPPRNFQNPGAFDYTAYLKARRTALLGSVKSARLIRPIRDARLAVLDRLPRLRGWIVARLRRAAGPGGETTASFLAALLVGEREHLSPDMEEALIRAGVYHIMALSGLNVALAALLAMSLLRFAPLPQGTRRLLAAGLVALYWAVARDSGSMSRATLMAVLCLCGGTLQRRVPGIGALAVAAIVILLSNPAWIADAGFQLSFTATLGILVLSPRWAGPAREALPGDLRSPAAARLRALGSWTLMSVRVSTAALAGTAMITARHFQVLTPAALPANLIAVPIAALLLGIALSIVLVDPFAPDLAGGLSTLASLLIDQLGALAAAISRIPGFSISVVPPSQAVVIWSTAAVLVAALCRDWRRFVAWLGLCAALLWTAGAGRWAQTSGALEVTALDVGQGDSIFVQFPSGMTMLVDAGGFARPQFDVGSRVVAPAIRAMGHLGIDILAITHAHRDHLGGAAAILRQLAPGALWLGGMPPCDPAVEELERLAGERGIPVVRPRRGVRLSIGGARLEVLNPGRRDQAGPTPANDDSLVLRLAYRRQEALLTGDLESPLESILIREGFDLTAGLLKVGHHGSRTSTSRPFLSAVMPRMAVISVGRSNPWGHPDAAVLDRVADLGITLFRTDQDGAVIFKTDGGAPWSARRLVGQSGLTAGRAPRIREACGR
jgi:competence protein ComEC